MANFTYLENDTYQAALAQKGLVVVNYFATWCGPCQMFGPIFEAVADKMAATHPEIKFYRNDIDASRQAAEHDSVETVPTVVIYQDGEEIDRQIGGLEANGLEKFIESNLGSNADNN